MVCLPKALHWRAMGVSWWHPSAKASPPLLHTPTTCPLSLVANFPVSSTPPCRVLALLTRHTCMPSHTQAHPRTEHSESYAQMCLDVREHAWLRSNGVSKSKFPGGDGTMGPTPVVCTGGGPGDPPSPGQHGQLTNAHGGVEQPCLVHVACWHVWASMWVGCEVGCARACVAKHMVVALAHHVHGPHAWPTHRGRVACFKPRLLGP